MVDAVNSFQKSKNRRKRKFKDLDEKISNCLDPRKTKMVIEFNDKESASIKSFAVKKRGQIKVPLDSCQVNYLCLQNCLLKVSFMKSLKHLASPKKMLKKI